MQTNVLGYPRIGSQRELKKACEAYWAGKMSLEKLQLTARQLRRQNWETLQQAGIDLIPSNDFSLYDQVLDMCLMTGVIPARFQLLMSSLASAGSPELYFAMARGYQKNGLDITAMEMTKWSDTNYHYLVPEFDASQQFRVLSTKCVDEFKEARSLGIHTKPVLLGPVSFLLLGKIKDENLHAAALLEQLLPVYIQLLQQLQQAGATWVQIDEPCLVLDLSPEQKSFYQYAYTKIKAAAPSLQILLATYFGSLQENTALALELPVQALHIDLVRAPEQLDAVLKNFPADKQLSLGVVNGRNIWKNDYTQSLQLVSKAAGAIGVQRLLLATSCSLLHTPYDLELEKDEQVLTPQIKGWMAFARQKVQELTELKAILDGNEALLEANRKSLHEKSIASIVHKPAVKARVAALTVADATRLQPFPVRQKVQEKILQLPLFPTTTIGSFPQTEEIRKLRADLKKGNITTVQYDTAIRKAIADAVQWQEGLRLDVLVHGEFERNDMVGNFGEQLGGFV
ncbi:5-methyltetrahydropteroyltriglutamate--homocysteine S-methyltransferase, partial [Chitinophaga sp. GbtcB8]|uniref:5-methyltetrahydropteroyltriglutamate-- homocysteine S-methyltransferase n=1 Tax=Chitinophaga sp. GbtcB8 TaxID=2824753 RepID=UPI0020C5C9C5